MSTWPANVTLPTIIQPGRYCNNGQLVAGVFMRRAVDAMNHVAAFRKKFLGCWSQNITTAAAGNGTFASYRGFVQTGHHCDYIQLVFLMLRPDGGTDPYVYATLAPSATGIISDTSEQIRHSVIDAGTDDRPSHWMWGKARLNAADNTSYFLTVNVVDEARVLAVAAWEVGINPVDDTVTGGVDPTVGVGDPIFDDKQDAVAVGTSEMLQANRSVVFSWGSYDGTGNSVTGVGYRNVIDTGIGAIAATSPGFFWESQYHNTYSRTDVPCVLAVYAERTAGLQLCLCKIDDGAGNTIVINNIAVAGWYTQTGLLPAAAATKYDVMARAGAAGETIRVDHVSFYEYE